MNLILTKMEQYKSAQIIMLPTKDATNRINCLNLTVSNKLHSWNTNGTTYNPNPQHLYILSDDEIQESEWCYDKSNKKVVQIIYKYKDTKNHYFVSSYISNKNEILSKGYSVEIEELKKIIATTDTSLKRVVGIGTFAPYPQPSQQFIEEYIESYNKGEVITNVLVEYEIDKITMACTCTDNIASTNCVNSYIDSDYHESCKKRFSNGEYWNKTFKPKVNPKDNTITIKKLKDSWNREEVIVLLNKLNNTLNIGSDLTLEQWIDKNL